VAHQLNGVLFRLSCAVTILLLTTGPAFGQELSLAVSLDTTTYGGDAYDTTEGDVGGEFTLGYETARGLRFASGVFVGKFDEPVSDPSFTAISVFFEPSWAFRPTSRVRPVVGARVGWERQRAGNQSTGLWAYGWGAAGVGGVEVRLGEPVSVGVRTIVTGLNIERDDGSSRNGVRVQVGASLILTWPLR
jgi:hypothetical protein